MSLAAVGRGFAEPTRGIVFQRELEERDTFGASSRFLIRLRTHEIADQGHILIGVVPGQLIHSFGVGIVIGVRGVGADELEPSAPIPRRPAYSIVFSSEQATQSGGCGFCTGFGKT